MPVKILTTWWMVIVWVSVFSGCASYPDGVSRQKVARINTQLGVEYLRQGKLDFALDNARKALAADADYVDAHSVIALIYSQQEAFDSANEHYTAAIDLTSTESKAYGGVHNNYGVFLCRQGDYPGAEEHFLLAIDNRGYLTKEIAYENAGMCVMEQNEMQKAESYFRKALQINPALPLALLQMATLQFQHHRYLPTRAYIQRFHEVTAYTAASLWLGIQVEKKLNDAISVEKFVNLLVANFPDSDETQQYLQLN